MKTNKQPVLSICIPTWNRSSFLRISLDSLFGQLNDIEKEDVEIFISDNCSSDATPNIIEEFIDKGMPIEQVQKILGHLQIDTTMQYAMVNQNNVKTSHQKYMS